MRSINCGGVWRLASGGWPLAIRQRFTGRGRRGDSAVEIDRVKSPQCHSPCGWVYCTVVKKDFVVEVEVVGERKLALRRFIFIVLFALQIDVNLSGILAPTG
jgi:hypothetical protein